MTPRVPGERPCYCRAGYRCPYCEQDAKREAKRRAEEAEARRHVENATSDGD